MKIGSHHLTNNLILAPMAGVTDRPFRQLCRQQGAGLTISEMVNCNPALLDTRKTKLRMDHHGEPGPVVVQIAGADPQMMADFARLNVDRGADIIDINMGCPAKKVCNVMAGSALLRNEKLVRDILEAVTDAVTVPVTLKMRTGWCPQTRNAPVIAHIAEQTGIAALTVHGRTRNCAYSVAAEYDTIASIKSRAGIPVIVNGDIDSAEKAAEVLGYTAADAVMIGRAAQGNPFIFRMITHYLRHGTSARPAGNRETGQVLVRHLENLYTFYGEYTGVRVARKHIAWYCPRSAVNTGFRSRINRTECARAQLAMVKEHFSMGNSAGLAA